MRWLLVLGLCGCATLNTAGMSESCKRLYDACLNTCPGASRDGRPVQGSLTQMEIAACTDRCNEQARRCQ
jgi:hypothetical protein